MGLIVDENNKIWMAIGWTGKILIFDTNSNTFIKNISLPDRHLSGTFGSWIWDMKFDKYGDLWFTDQDSNSIWRYFVKENKFENYRIPTKGSYPSSLAIDSQNRVRFTEWTENKLGVLYNERIDQIPISLSLSEDKITLDKKSDMSEIIDIYVHNNKINDTKNKNINNKSLIYAESDNSANVTMFATSSISRSGILWNLTSHFTEDKFTIKNPQSYLEPYRTALEIKPTKDVFPGNYTLTISARYNSDITISKILDLNIQ